VGVGVLDVFIIHTIDYNTEPAYEPRKEGRAIKRGIHIQNTIFISEIDNISTQILILGKIPGSGICGLNTSCRRLQPPLPTPVLRPFIACFTLIGRYSYLLSQYLQE
jgi:hypothetical protein